MPRFLASLNGAQFRPAYVKQIINALNMSDELTLQREPENAYDENAIKVLDVNGEFLGYVAKDTAAEIAPLMDAAGEAHCEVVGFLAVNKPNLEITIDDEA